MSLKDIVYIHDDNEVISSAVMLFENHYITPKVLIDVLEEVDTPSTDIEEYFSGMIMDKKDWDVVNMHLYGETYD